MAGPNNAKKKLHSGRHASAIKRARQTLKLRRYNKQYLTVMRKAIKAVRAAIRAKDTKGAQDALKQVTPIIAKTAGKGIIPARRGSRVISRLTQAVHQLSA